MVSTLLLLGCTLAPGQTPAARAEWTVQPQLTPGQELVFTGTYKEEFLRGQVQANRNYRLETRVLVLDAGRPNVPVALLTVLRTRGDRPANDAPPSSVRLERAAVGSRGQLVTTSGAALTAPLDGPATLEASAFLELPGERLTVDQSWLVEEPGRPVLTWRVVGSDQANGTSCVKIVGEQKSDDWDQPRADRLAWHRLDTLWIAPRTGFAYRVERVIEKREPGRVEPSWRSELRYELESSPRYTGQLFEDRQQEIVQALAFAELAAPLLPTPTQHAPQLNALAGKIASHLERQPPTPYREAVLEVRRRVEAGKRGEVPVALPAETPTETGVATVGKAAPEFIAPDFRTRASTNLKHWLGKPILLIFFRPNSVTADPLLRFGQRVADAYPGRVAVLGLAMTDDGAPVRHLAEVMRLSIPLLNGSGLRRSYAVAETPTLVLIDGAGVVRGSFVGWGNEVPGEVIAELQRWLPRK